MVSALLWTGCGEPAATKENRPAAEAGSTLFTQLPAAYTNVDFANQLREDRNFNVFTYRNYHNGGGVAIGDLNGDGRQDLFFTANQGANRLYLNRGDWWFDDVTEAAGVGGRRAWSTGVSLADVNGDGRLDIYVANSGEIEGDDRQNELYINQGTDADGVPTFAEQAAAYGLDDTGYSTHAAFFDYDRDGDLDLYLLNNAFTPVTKFDIREDLRAVRNEDGGDKLYQNQGDGSFVDVTEAAGIYSSEIGFGLGVSVGDVNRDGWPDMFISNDFFERDYLYLNNQDGTFREVLTEQMPHTSLSSMGADVGDINNDGWPDLFVTDMLPEMDRRLKTTTSFETWDEYQLRVRNGYYHQVMRNMMQLNNGNGTFSDVSEMAGVSATDWSWGALIADFDLDGHKDLFVANGVLKDVTNQDFIDSLSRRETAERLMREGRVEFLNIIEDIPSERLSNYAFRNAGDRTFTDQAAAWGLDAPSFSNGAAYGDLDGDGDLDLVINNLNHEAFVYRNEADSLRANRYLQIELAGEAPNRFGVGAQITAEHEGARFYHEQMPTRGFQSTVGHRVTLGVGRADTLDRLTVAWPDGRVQALTDVATNQRLTLRQAEAQPPGPETPPLPAPQGAAARDQRFAEVTGAVDLDYRHDENTFVDFNREPLLPKKVSTEGPKLATADVNGDGRTDVFLGGAKGQAGQLFVQRPDGRFVRTSADAFEQDAISEDVGAAFFDANGDGAPDLYVVSGGNAFGPRTPALQDRLYLNDGRGQFARARDRLPSVKASGSVVRPADFDGDGDVDLFVGGRVVPWRYGLAPRSVLLENDGTGTFSDVTDEAAPGLADVGMVTDAVWADVNGTGAPDLMVVGEWMPLTLFRNAGGALEQTAAPGLENTHGWWNRIIAEDLDGDGDLDFVAGNLGHNTRLHASAEEPVRMHVSDFDNNGYLDQVVSHYKAGTSSPMVLRDPLLQQLGFLRQKYPTHAAYAEQSMQDVFTEQQLAEATVREARYFATSYIENTSAPGSSPGQAPSFSVRALPFEAQTAPMYGLVAEDMDGDGATDLLLSGNFHGFPPNIGRADASYGVWLRGDGTGRFTAIPARTSGLRVTGQARDMALIDHARHGRLLVVARNDAPLQLFTLDGDG